MNKLSDYPVIGSIRGDNAPFEILQKLYRIPDIISRRDGNTIKVEKFKKSFWRKEKKIIEVNIQKNSRC